MDASDYISLASAAIALFALAYTHFTNTKKYEIFNVYRTEVLNWFIEVSNIIIRLKIEAKCKFPDESVRRDLLSKLSARIEQGRFYFPNIDNDYGGDKPLAYRGYRNVILDFLVFSYRLFEKSDAHLYLKHAETLQRYFTSNIYEIIDPKKFLKESEKYTQRVLSHTLTFEDYMNADPELLETYIKSYN
jgi:hypothetical protein